MLIVVTVPAKLASTVELLTEVPSKVTVSAEVGTVSELQLAAVLQFVSTPPPPSQVYVAASTVPILDEYAKYRRAERKSRFEIKTTRVTFPAINTQDPWPFFML